MADCCGSPTTVPSDDAGFRWVRSDEDYLAFDWNRMEWIPASSPKNALQFDGPTSANADDPQRAGGEMSCYLKGHLSIVHLSGPQTLVVRNDQPGLVYEASIADLTDLGLATESTPAGSQPPDCSHLSVHRKDLSKAERRTLYNRLSKAMYLAAGSPPEPPPANSQ